MASKFFIRQANGAVQGPFEWSRIQEWVSEGKVREEMSFSQDGDTWWLGSDWPDLFPSVAPPVASPPSPRSAPPLPPPLPQSVACPYCSAEIKHAAAKCKHCGEWLAADERVGPARGRASGYGPGRTRVGSRRPTQASRTGSQRSSKKKWLLIGVGVFIFIGIVGQASDRAKPGKGGTVTRTPASTTASLPLTKHDGQTVAIYSRDFMYWKTGRGRAIDAAPFLPQRMDPDDALPGVVEDIKRRYMTWVQSRGVDMICFQWNSELTPDEFGKPRGHTPDFWALLSVATINRIRQPREVSPVNWLKHILKDGDGRWPGARGSR